MNLTCQLPSSELATLIQDLPIEQQTTIFRILPRRLALGEVMLRDWWRIMRREIFSGLALGSILGGIGFLRISVWSAFQTCTARTGFWPL